MSIVKTYSLRIATLLAALHISVSVTAQEYRYEAGIGGGISGYLGDVNQSNVLKHPGFAGNALFRYLINKRFAVKADFRKLKRISPYLSLGLGATYSTSKNFVPNIPISFGAKYKINRRLNLALEMRARMMLGDGVDGLKDLYGVESGVLKNNDWCPTLMLSISYEFGEICKICHYVK